MKANLVCLLQCSMATRSTADVIPGCYHVWAFWCKCGMQSLCMQVMQLITYKVPSADAVCANTTTLLGLYGFNH